MEGEVKSGGHEDRSLQAEVTDTKAWRWGGEGWGAARLDLSSDRENRTARSMARVRPHPASALRSADSVAP